MTKISSLVNLIEIPAGELGGNNLNKFFHLRCLKIREEYPDLSIGMVSKGNPTEIGYTIWLLGTNIGYADVVVEPDKSEILWTAFNPMAFLANGEMRGIGTWSHVAVLKRFKKEVQVINGYEIVHGGISLDRRSHLEAMDLFNDWKFFRDLLCLERRMAFSKYYERSLSYAIRKGIEVNV